MRYRVLALAAVTGAVTGAIVAGFEWVTREQLLDRVKRAANPWQVVLPIAALGLAAVALRAFGGVTPATADEYIKDFHDQPARFDVRAVAARLLASVSTLGLGGAMGYEGPSIYVGAAIGSNLQGRVRTVFSRLDTKLLLVCGAAAGVAAIFKAPATGLVFALEVPYQEDLARRMLLPAGIAAAMSYVVFVSFAGTTPLFVAKGSPPFDLRDLGGAAVLGVLCGIGARGFTFALRQAKHRTLISSPLLRALVAGVLLAGVALAALGLFHHPLTVGPGYDNLDWAFDPKRAVWLVVALFGLRAMATVLTVWGGGAGGLFIPMVVEGALLGRAVGGLFRSAATGTNFFALIGVAAFLGAGYRVPLAGVMFAAETSGRPGFIVPGLIATMVAQLFMGNLSASEYQLVMRTTPSAQPEDGSASST